MTKAFTIRRTDVSPYQKDNFVPLELKALTELGFHYDLDCKSPEILLTNTLTDMGMIHQSIDVDQIQLIIHPNSGYDNYPLSFVENVHCPIILGNEIRAQAVVEYTMAQVFEHFTTTQHKKAWDMKRAFPRKLISQQNFLVIGYGLIGSQIENTLLALNAKVSIYDPYQNKNLDLKKEISNADVIILASSLNKTSYHLINEENLNTAKKDVTLINPARGSLIQTDALIHFLEKNSESFAYLDVFEKEPRQIPSLESLPNVKLTSHIAGVHDSLDQSIIDFEVKVLKDFKSLNINSFAQKYHSANLKNRLVNGMII